MMYKITCGGTWDEFKIHCRVPWNNTQGIPFPWISLE